LNVLNHTDRPTHEETIQVAETPIIGAIFLFAGNFAPRGFAFCAGQILPISQNSALFSILGTTYGGNGTSTFALPDLRGRAPIGAGNGGPLTPVQLGEAAGVQNVSLLVSNIPPHNHLVNVNSGAGSQSSAANNYLATTADPTTADPIPTYEATATGGAHLNTSAVTMTGSGIPINVRNPYLGLNYIIALVGIYPSRN
jgi:microcystin-dependent protein